MLPRRSTLLKLVIAASVCAHAISVQVALGTTSLRDNDQLWRLSTRGVHSSEAESASQLGLAISRYDPREAAWIDATWEDFARSQQETSLTSVYVHGNRVEPGEDSYHGLAWYRTLVEADERLPAMQFVIWSWPSSQIRGQLRDVRLKYWRAQEEIAHLHIFLREVPPQRPTFFVGFSYGGLIVSGALAEAAGDEPSPVASRQRIAFLVAAAEPISWLLPDQRHGAMFASARDIHVLVNRCDPALKRFHAVDKCLRPAALGYAGIDESCLSADAQEHLHQWDVSAAIGKIHDEHPYRCSATVRGLLRDAIAPLITDTPETGNKEPENAADTP